MLKEVQVLDRLGKAFHVFRAKDGTEFEVPCTKAEYLALGLPNPVNPTHPNGEWYCSYATALVDTPSGLIEEGTYFVDNGLATVKNAGEIKNFPASDMQTMTAQDVQDSPSL